MKSRGGKSQTREEKKKEGQGRDKVRRKKLQVREKVAKSRNTLFFQWFVAPEGPKVGSLKRRVRSHLARWEMKSCTPLWREAHLEAKKLTLSKSEKNVRVLSFVAVSATTTTTLHYTTLHYNYNYNYNNNYNHTILITLHYTTLHCTPLHYTN